MTRPHIGQIDGTGTIDSVYGNVYADPMFVDPDNGDLRLQKGSPCIDAGAPWILDVDGTRSDIGAFGGPGGSVYVYQDLRPKAPASMAAMQDKNRVILSWERNSESDFLHYVLFRTTEPDAPLDSQHALIVSADQSEPTITSDRLASVVTASNSTQSSIYPYMTSRICGEFTMLTGIQLIRCHRTILSSRWIVRGWCRLRRWQT
jgi:hypothetical protein